MESSYLIMKLHFDSNQEYQINAIRTVTDIFEGQPLKEKRQAHNLAARRQEIADVEEKK